MIKNKSKLERFYRRLIKEENIFYLEALSIYEMLYKEALSLDVINSENILDGLDIDLKVARIINTPI